jgi:twinkle protein
MMTAKQHLPCPNPDCNSSDAYSIQDNGWGKCFSCGKNFPPDGQHAEAPAVRDNKPSKSGNVKELSPIAEVFRPFASRQLTKETIQRYKVMVSPDPEATHFVAKYPLYDANGNHVANKVRRQEVKDRKEGPPFIFEGSKEASTLFGMHAFPPGSARAITITEGQDDAMAAYQMMGSKYPCVSIHGASSAEQDLRSNFEYLNSFDKIVICFDNDEAGLKAANAATKVGFPIGKLHVLTLRKHKDANEYLLARESDAFTKEWWQAPTHKPDGLKLGTDMWDEIIDRKEHFTVNYPFEGLNRLTYGLRLSELIVVTAETGVGKTSILKHIEHRLLTDETVKEKGYGVGFLHLEEPNGDTALGLLSVHNGVPYHIPGVDRPREELRQAYDEVLNNGRVVIWDHFGSNTVDAVVDKIRHMAAMGCKYIVIDHLSIIVSDQSGDERKQLDEITTKVKTLCMEQDLCVIAVVHTNRQGQIRGTAGVEQLANIVIRLERNKTEPNEWRRNVTKVTVEKNRFTGYTGPASYLWYNKDTARLIELEDDEVATFEAGDALNDAEQPFR